MRATRYFGDDWRGASSKALLLEDLPSIRHSMSRLAIGLFDGLKRLLYSVDSDPVWLPPKLSFCRPGMLGYAEEWRANNGFSQMSPSLAQLDEDFWE